MFVCGRIVFAAVRSQCHLSIKRTACGAAVRSFSDKTESEPLPDHLFRSPMVPYDQEDDRGTSVCDACIMRAQLWSSDMRAFHSLTAPLLERAWTIHPQVHQGTMVWLHELAQDDKATPTIFTMISPEVLLMS